MRKQIKIFINGMLETRIHRVGIKAITIEIDDEIVFDELEESEVNSQADEKANSVIPALKSTSNKRDGSLSDNIHSQINNEIGKDYVRNSDEVKE